MTKKVLITGISGQDGSYLAELLLSKGYEVYGLIRRHSSQNLWRLENILSDIILIHGDITDQISLSEALKQSDPDEIYHMASMSFVHLSWSQPSYTYEANILGTLRLLEAIRQYNKTIKIYHAASSEMYGKVQQVPQNENTPFYPLSPYAVSKVAAFYTCLSYRMSYNMFICNGIAFNHESPRRGLEFVTRKITHGIGEILKGNKKFIELGDITAKRDWGYASNYVEGFWKMLQQKESDDYVLATGKMHSVEDFLKLAFEYAGLGDYLPYIIIDNKYKRPADVQELRGDYTKAKTILGWEPKVQFEELVKIMVDADLEKK